MGVARIPGVSWASGDDLRARGVSLSAVVLVDRSESVGYTFLGREIRNVYDPRVSQR
jgi:hypothetical protein